MSRTASGAVIHRNVALIACDTPATLQETFRKLGELDVHAVPIGDRHVLLPAQLAETILGRLREHGQFPRLVGAPEIGESLADAAPADSDQEGE